MSSTKSTKTAKKRVTTLVEWQQNFREGKYDAPDRDTQCEAGWGDWFCEVKDLAEKTRTIGRVISGITSGGKVDPAKTTVLFFNSLAYSDDPDGYVDARSYDDFRICNARTGTVKFTVLIHCPGERYTYVVYGSRNRFREPLARFSYADQLLQWLNRPW